MTTPIDLEELKKYHTRKAHSRYALPSQNESSNAILRLIQVIEIQREGLNSAKDACLCDRLTRGFNYGEHHDLKGRAKTGKRWLLPYEIIDGTASKADAILKGEKE